MNTFKKTTLYTALAGIGALGMAGTASAVHVNPDGLGQVLIYPYYTVNSQTAINPFNSLLSVVNSTASAKAVKVRFLEGKNSVEVLDFNLYLSPHDVWTVAVVPTTAGGAGIVTHDKSCTTPTVSSDDANPNAFVNTAYAGDSGGDGLDRTKEGYVEIIEMGNVTGTTATGVTHVSGVPPCTGLSDAVANANTVLGDGGLFGGVTLVDVLSGEDFTADAVALEAFNAGVSLWAAPGSVNPTLEDVNPKATEVFNGSIATTYTFTLGQNADPVSAALMHNTLMNEYVLDAATASGTDWVITMPTKRFYVNGSSAPIHPFQRAFSGGTSCDDVGITTWDREERTITVTTGFSPPAPQSPLSLCYEANVVTFKGSNVLASANIKDLTAATLPANAENGWARFDFTTSLTGAVGSHVIVADDGSTFNGLPVIGFAVQTFVNGTLTEGALNVQSNYGGNFVHKTTKSITAPAP